MQVSSSIIRMKRNKLSNSGQRQRKTPQPSMSPHSPPPPTVSPLSYQREDNEEDEPTLWPNQRRRSAGPLNPPQFQVPPIESMGPGPAYNWNHIAPNQLINDGNFFYSGSALKN